jgi:hypothetical protein
MPDDRLRVVHHSQGRLRLRAPRLRAAPDLARRVVETLESEAGVSAVRWAPVTGSVTIEYETHRVQLPRLVQTVLVAGDFGGVEVDAPIVGLAAVTDGDRVRDGLARLNDSLHLLTSGRLDLRAAVPGALAGLGLLTFALRKKSLPRWYDLLFWSFVTFVNLNPAAPREPFLHVPRT